MSRLAGQLLLAASLLDAAAPPRPTLLGNSPPAAVYTSVYGPYDSAKQHDRFVTAQQASLDQLQNFIMEQGDESEEIFESLGALKNDLTYGEFELESFESLLAAAEPADGEVFIDVGSGCGRLVCAAAMLYTWSRTIGVEVLEPMDALATDLHKQLAAAVAASEDDVTIAPCEFMYTDAESALPRLFASPATPRAVVFVYATCFTSMRSFLPALSEALGTSLPDGSRVIVVDRQLLNDEDMYEDVGENARWSFEEQAQLTVENRNTYVGESRAVVYTVRRNACEQ